jgi:hypothetical protein
MMSTKYVKALLDGRKTTTIRPGALRVAGRVYIHSGGRIVAVAEVGDVVYKLVSELTDGDAVADGFRDRGELISFLKRQYPGLRDDAIVTIIHFRSVQRVDLPEDVHYGGLSPVKVARMALARLRLSRREREILEAVVETGSVRRAALRLFGTIDKRRAIRRVLRRAARALGNGGTEGKA